MIRIQKNNSPWVIGRQWEACCIDLLRNNGYEPEDMASKGLPYDIVANGLRIQCKSLVNKSCRKQQTDYIRIGKGGTGSCKGYKVGSLDIFMVAVKTTGDWYCIPAEAVGSSISEGKRFLAYQIQPKRFARYKNNLDALANGGHAIQQPSLF